MTRVKIRSFRQSVVVHWLHYGVAYDYHDFIYHNSVNYVNPV